MPITLRARGSVRNVAPAKIGWFDSASAQAVPLAARRSTLPDTTLTCPSRPALGRQLRAALPGARLHGPRSHPGDWDESYDRASIHIGRLFEAGQAIVGVCAAGILIRSVAPFLVAKREEPAVVAVAEDGSVAVPLIGGHHGANALARVIAELTGGIASITT